MRNKKKKSIGRIVRPDSTGYTFLKTEDEAPPRGDPQRKDDRRKKDEIIKTLKDLAMEKARYKSVRQSPKTQQGHSPVYE